MRKGLTAGAACAVLLAFAALPALAGDAPLHAADRHLNMIPRTAQEAARIAAVTAWPTDFSKPEAFEGKPGSAATVRARGTADAFSQASANLGFAREMDFKLGNALFRKVWVSAPSSTLASDGLGPLFNARACQECHIKDGRGGRLLKEKAPSACCSESRFRQRRTSRSQRWRPI